MGDQLLPLVQQLGPIAGWIVLAVVLLLLVVERLTGWEGVVTRTLRAIARRQIAREERAAELEKAQRVRGSAEIRDLRSQRAYLEGELEKARAAARATERAHIDDVADLRRQLRQRDADLETQRDLIAELTHRT
jgi:hypothetical protein